MSQAEDDLPCDVPVLRERLRDAEQTIVALRSQCDAANEHARRMESWGRRNGRWLRSVIAMYDAAFVDLLVARARLDFERAKVVRRCFRSIVHSATNLGLQPQEACAEALGLYLLDQIRMFFHMNDRLPSESEIQGFRGEAVKIVTKAIGREGWTKLTDQEASVASDALRGAFNQTAP